MKIGVHLLKLWPKNKVAVFLEHGVYSAGRPSRWASSHIVCFIFVYVSTVFAVFYRWSLKFYLSIRRDVIFFGCRVLCAKVVGATSSEGFQLIVNWHNGSTSILIHGLSLSWFITEWWTDQSRLRRPIKGRREHRVLARQVRDLFSVHWSEIWDQ